MRYLSINLDVRNKAAVVVGGGRVAARKCAVLLDAGARVTVIAPALDSSLEEMRREKRLHHEAREFKPGDLEGALLVFAVTDNPLVNRAVADEANRLSLLADIADAPDLGSFTLPAVLRRGDLQIAISTAGKSPALARHIRRQLEVLYGEEYARALELMGNLREKLLTEKGNSAYNKWIFNELAELLPSLVRDASAADIDNLLKKLLDPEAALTEFGFRGKDTE
jgi:precorrin-2 dehydrogenase/sirohydrochlorin ferrochelatase